ncbi:MAG TPA: hypothetical protein VKN76_12585 [Kiloniellaceae bacterium]|nr:hypothetical protein [Kiloniellaceae bacterium]
MLMPLAKFEPDKSNFNPNGSDSIKNCQPTSDGWGPLQALAPLSAALAAAPRGAMSFKTDAGSFKTYAGTSANLYVLDSTDYTFTEKSRSTDDYSLADGVFWRWLRFGNNAIATAVGSDFPQFSALDTADAFANLTNASFEAGLGAVVGDFVVFARIDGDNRKLKWSGVNDMTFWTVGQRGSDEQIIPDGGEIQAIIGQSQNGIIVQENAIRMMSFDPGSGVVFRFVTLDPDRGAFASRSVVNIGPNDFAFLAKDGFYRWSGGQMNPIGAERVNLWFFETCASDKYDLVSGTSDPFRKVIRWRFEQDDGTNLILSYNWQLDRWFYETNNALDIFSAATAGETLDTLTTLYSTLAGMPYALGSRFYKGGIPGLAGFDSDNKLGFFDGDNLEAIIETADMALNYPRRAVTDRITVLVDTDDAQVALASKETQGTSEMFGSFLSRETNLPFINSRVGGRWHRGQIKIPSGSTWTNASGIDVEFVDGGFQ